MDDCSIYEVEQQQRVKLSDVFLVSRIIAFNSQMYGMVRGINTRIRHASASFLFNKIMSLSEYLKHFRRE